MGALAALDDEPRVTLIPERLRFSELIVNSTSVGAVNLSLAWVSEGGFVLSVDQPPARMVRAGGNWYRESRWGAALAVSLPDVVHVLDATEVQVAIHSAGVALGHRMPVEVLAELVAIGLERVGVDEVRRIAAEWAAICLASARERISVSLWRKEVRRVWGSRREMDRACLAKLDVLDAVRGDARLAA